jgi:hypothetical protein
VEKVIAALWAPTGVDRVAFGDRLRATLPAALCEAGASRMRLNLRDAEVAPAAGLLQSWQSPQQDAVVQFWLPSANAHFRRPVDTALASHCTRFAAWLVCESTIVANVAHPPSPGHRTAGWSQASFISFRSDISHEAAVAHWRDHHTRVAIETQSNFEYIQNIIVAPLTEDAPPYDAFVEECFPIEAMSASEAFFDAVGDPERYAANVRAMSDSCAAFIDFSRIDIIPTSQFDMAE